MRTPDLLREREDAPLIATDNSVGTSVRPSLALYNTKDDVDAVVRALLDLVALRSPARGARSSRG